MDLDGKACRRVCLPEKMTTRLPPSYTALLRQDSGEGLSPPLEQQRLAAQTITYTDGFHLPHCEIRPGWVPSLPRGRRCSPGQMPCPAVACRFSAAIPCTPLPHPTCEAPFYEASTRVHTIHPSGLPLACDHPDGTGRPWAFPCAPHLAVTGDARQGGAGREHAPGTMLPT
jgi:hypothetical protein